MSDMTPISKKIVLPAIAAVMLAIPGAFAAEERPVIKTTSTASEEVQAFCGNIADAARDQRYLLQKQELEKLQKDVDDRIALLETRRAEYEEWLKRRNDFLKSAEGGLVEIYRKMKPDAAASQLAELNPEIASAIVMKLSPSKSSTILGEMPADKAAELTRIIAAAAKRQPSKDPS